MNCYSQSHNKGIKRAFTLAEVLLTLAIVGIVAAITIPTMVSNSQKKEIESGFFTSYKILNEATTALKAKHQVDNVKTVFGGNHMKMMEEYCSVLNCVQTCIPGQSQGVCFPAIITKFSGDDYSNLGNHYTARLSNNVCLRFWTHTSTYADFFFDVNCFKGPNVIGVDIQQLGFDDNGVKFGGGDYSDWCNKTSTYTWTGQGCGKRIIEEGGIKYW